MNPLWPHRAFPAPDEGSRVYDELKRHEVHVLRDAGLTIDRIAAKTGVGRNTVKRILKEPPVARLHDSTKPILSATRKRASTFPNSTVEERASLMCIPRGGCMGQRIKVSGGAKFAG